MRTDYCQCLVNYGHQLNEDCEHVVLNVKGLESEMKSLLGDDSSSGSFDFLNQTWTHFMTVLIKTRLGMRQ